MFGTIPHRFSVIPLNGKIPLVGWQEFTKRCATEDEKAAWCKQYPSARAGIITGEISGLLVLDEDGIDGAKSLAGYAIPRTVTVNTPHGKHYYFKLPLEAAHKITTKVGILNKVDVRGNGGLVAFYGWSLSPFVAPFAMAPQWLIDLLPDRNAPRVLGESFKKMDYVEKIQNLKDGNRNETLFKLASGLRARGYDFNEIYALLLSTAKEIQVDEAELRTICNSSCKYPAGQRPPVSEVQIPDNFEQFLANEEKVEYLVPGIFVKNSIAFVAGLPETCKTWTLVDLAVEFARKEESLWLGKYSVKHAKVLYIDQERAKSETQRRFKAVIRAKGLDPREFNETLSIKSGTTLRMNLSESFNGFKNLLAKLRPDVVLIDSFKTFHTADINSNVAMQEVMEKIKELKNEFGCTFIFIYHENKGAHERVGADSKKKQITFEYMAGASVMSEVPETILITVKQDQNSSFLWHVKNTYGTKVAPLLVSVENVTSDGTQIRVVGR